MKPRLIFLCTAVVALILVSPVKALNHAVIWDTDSVITDLGSLADGQDSFARAINDSEQVAGYSYLSDGVTSHGFIWNEVTGMVDIGTPGGDYCAPYGINSSGAVVGLGSLAEGKLVAFYWTSSGGFVTLPQARAGTVATGVNDSGDVAGFRAPAVGREGFFWNPTVGTSRGLGFLGGDSSLGLDINNLHHVTGGATLSNGMEHLIFWRKRTGLIDLGTPPRVVSAEGVAINDQDEIVGNDSSTLTNPFYWSEGTGYRILAKLGSQVIVTHLNNSGQIVGSSEISDSAIFHAVLWSNSLSAPQDLGTLPGGTSSGANSINNLGQVVGYSSLSAD